MRYTTPWASLSIASVGAVMAVMCLTSVSSAHSIVATASTFSPHASSPQPSAHALSRTTLDDYQPPDNGGPGKSGGSGTRWQ